MVLKKLILIFVLLLSYGKSQQLFYTDSYLSNFYKSNEQTIIFHNNIFALLDKETSLEVERLIQNYFEQNQLQAVKQASPNQRQLVYTYQSSSFEALDWSMSWHKNEEPELSKLLKSFLAAYFQQEHEQINTIEQAAILKLAYYDWQNFGKRTSDFSRTKIHFSAVNIDTKKYNREHVAPNLSLSRIVTSSFANFYNEAYAIQELDETISFVFGPSHKARLKDCISMHIYCSINDLNPPTYIVRQTILELANERKTPAPDELAKAIQDAKNRLKFMANGVHISLYSIHDLNIIEDIVEAYTLADYLDFERIYIDENSYNIAYPLSQKDSSFSKAILNEQVLFKSNATLFSQEKDSLTLNTLARFLLNNPAIDLLLIGTQDEGEYTKIDKEKYRTLVDSYDKYPPVKSSKRADLAIYRAVVVFDYLVKKGVHPNRISCLSAKSSFEDKSNSTVKWVLK